LVEQRTENPRVGGSIPPLATKDFAPRMRGKIFKSGVSADFAPRKRGKIFIDGRFHPSVRVRKIMSLPTCPQCHSAHVYEDGAMLVCPECAHEWPKGAAEPAEAPRVVRDAVGNVLQDGDAVTVIKDLKVKGSSTVVKVGTKVKNIRLVEGDHDIDCRIDGIGAMGLKSEFVKKA
jgi:protein PhnA